MRSSVRAVLLVAGVLLAIAWFGRERALQEQLSNEPNDAPEVAKPAEPEPGSQIENPAIARLSVPNVEPADAEAIESPAYAGNDPSRSDTPRSTKTNLSGSATGGSVPEAYANLLPSGAKRADAANDDVSSEDEPVAAFEGVGRFDCEFSDGYNSAFWEGKLQSMTASWQGGPIVYDSIDADGGKAQMIGSSGATGSLKGQADAQVASAVDRIEFLSRLENGHLVFTTVFGRRDEAGRYIAVMSRHEGGNYLGSQFRGFCR